MKTTPLSKSGKKFLIYGHECNRLAPFFILPAVWVERRSQGLRVSVKRWTFIWGHHRFHIGLGQTHKPTQGSWSNPEYGLADFYEWAQHFVEKSGKHRFDRNSFERWLDQSEHKALVAWGGAKHHYSRILLVRDYLQAQSLIQNKNPFGDDVSLSLSLSGKSPVSEKRFQKQEGSFDKSHPKSFNENFDKDFDKDLNEGLPTVEKSVDKYLTNDKF